MKTLTNKYRVLPAVLSCLFIQGCGALLTLEASRTKYDGGMKVEIPSLTNDPFIVEVSKKFGLMSYFALLAYRDDLKGNGGIDGNGCRYADGSTLFESEVTKGMPPGWKRYVYKESPLNRNGDEINVLPCYDKNGLFYETYILEKNNQIAAAVIAYRGTENGKNQWMVDWFNNFSTALGIESNQYKIARLNLLPLIDHLNGKFRSASNPPKIFVVGHSLGGGLAQQAGYLSKSIAEVFTYNTSPVTNWTFLRLEGHVEEPYPIIHRVYHGGEFLEKIRFISTSFTASRYRRHDIGLQFGDRNSFGGHSMKILSCNFADVLVKSQAKIDVPELNFDSNFISHTVLSESYLCGDKKGAEK